MTKSHMYKAADQQTHTPTHHNIKVLIMMLLTLMICPYLVQNHLIRYISDNKAAFSWLKKESATCNEAARDILFLCLDLKRNLNSQIKADCIEDTENWTTEALS